jgi:hypothetical protein
LASLGSRFTLLNYSITLIGDDGIVIGSAEKVNTYFDNLTFTTWVPAFYFNQVNQTTIEIWQVLKYGGGYNSTQYFQTNATNWDDTTNNRGYLEVFYAN